MLVHYITLLLQRVSGFARNRLLAEELARAEASTGNSTSLGHHHRSPVESRERWDPMNSNLKKIY